MDSHHNHTFGFFRREKSRIQKVLVTRYQRALCFDGESKNGPVFDALGYTLDFMAFFLEKFCDTSMEVFVDEEF